jgi:hypothetical protein
MYYKDYIWTTKYSTDDPKVTGEPDKTLVSRKEGWEMLYFINKLAENGIGRNQFMLVAIEK